MLVGVVVIVAGLVYVVHGRAVPAEQALQARGQALAAAHGCAGCHTPGGGPPLSGQLMGPWLAPNITPDPVSGIGAWPREDVYRYLRQGGAPGRAQADGPMAAAVEALRDSSDDDVRALVAWLARQPTHRDPADQVAATVRGAPLAINRWLRGASYRAPDSALSGDRLYSGACASCHAADGSGTRDRMYPSLFHNSAVGRRAPYNLLATLVFGVQRQDSGRLVMMPSFDGRNGDPAGLTDDELATLANFIVAHFGDPAAATITSRHIATARAGAWQAGAPTPADSTRASALAARGQLLAVGGGAGPANTACFRCHGLQGQGDAAAAFPRLAGLDARYFAKQMRDFRSAARPSAVMGPIARQLDSTDGQAAAQYYAALPARLPPLRPRAAGGSLARRGALLYARGVPERGVQPCASCHGPDGRGTHPLFAAVVQPASYVDAQLRLWRAGTRRNDIGGVMGTVSRRMTDEGIRAVSAYIGGLAP
ncbi:MAG: c-type cytochrome [Gemmatimonadaceae bacterium]